MKKIFNICILFLCLGLVSVGQENGGLVVNKYRHYVLNTTTNVAVGYSTRRLNVNYAGAAIRVRRSSDNTTTDIGFTANGELDTAALKSFVGTANGFVATWYDQGPNGYHVTQSTASQQPKIVNAGTIYRNSAGRPYILFINANTTVLTNAAISASAIFTSGYIGNVYLVAQASPSSSNTSVFGFSDGSTNRWQVHLNENGGLGVSTLSFDAGSTYSRIQYNNAGNVGLWKQYTISANAGTNNMNIRINGTTVSTGTYSSAAACSATTWYVGAIPTFPGSWYHDGGIAELLIVNNGNAISPLMENNQISYWGL